MRWNWNTYRNNNAGIPPYRTPIWVGGQTGGVPLAPPRPREWQQLEQLAAAVRKEVGWEGGVGIALGPPVQGQNLPNEALQAEAPGAATPNGSNSDGLVAEFNRSRNTHFDLWVNGPTKTKGIQPASARWVYVGRFTVDQILKKSPSELAKKAKP